MASPARMDTLDAQVLIEEQVDTGLRPMLENYRSPHGLGQDRKDELNKHLTLYPSRPLPQFNHPYAQAFAAEDSHSPQRSVYALVLDNSIPYRLNPINELAGFVNPHLCTLHGAGTVHCSHLGESRMVLFMDQPQGQSLAEVIKAQGRLHEHRVMDFVLQPLVRALAALRERKISHGNIRPEGFFLGDSSVLGECISAPCGTLTHYLYEPPERISCTPLGRGEANEKTDAYAVGVLAYELIYGLDKLKAMSREEFTRLAMDIGCYNAFAGSREFSDMYTDFFRGVLTDNPNERWGLDQLLQWLDGKRFNMIAPSASKEASRAFTFMGENYFNRRVLAFQFQRHWRETAKDIKHMKLDRWAEMSLHKPEMAERIERALRIAGDASTDRHVNDMMTRIISILDPAGPIRGVSLTLRPDGIGPLIASFMDESSSTELNHLLTIIETDVSNYWSDLDNYNKLDQNAVLWKLQRVRPYLKSRAFGFGLERVLYDLNPSLSCQSPLLKQYHILTVNEALKALDAQATALGPDTSFMDRHLAAFVASKTDMGKEIRLLDLQTIPALADNPELVVLKILAKAQQRNERLVLVGLATWAAMRIEKMLDEIHNRTIRRQMKQQLRKLAATGSLNDVLSAVVNREMAVQDHEGFAKAIALHQINHSKIERFQNPKLIEKQANELGGKLASTISNIILFITAMVVIGQTFGL
ncbi:MAG: hypothetical protein DI582_02125 [Azospirillum brasilense]|nr:MAG: hypothetical protein DI582_02125 [Azospirillum brasilense]